MYVCMYIRTYTYIYTNYTCQQVNTYIHVLYTLVLWVGVYIYWSLLGALQTLCTIFPRRNVWSHPNDHVCYTFLGYTYIQTMYAHAYICKSVLCQLIHKLQPTNLHVKPPSENQYLTAPPVGERHGSHQAVPLPRVQSIIDFFFFFLFLNVPSA